MKVVSHRMFRANAAGLALLLVMKANANEAVTGVIHRFMEAVYSNDNAGYEATIVPVPDGAELVGDGTLSAEDIKRVKDDVARMELLQAEPYRHKGKVVTAGGKGVYPIGTKSTFMTGFRGVSLVIPVENTDKGWKVDVRFWLAGRAEYEESDPEIVAKKFLYHLIIRDGDVLKEVSTSGSRLDGLLKGEPPMEDQYVCLAMEMPVVEAREGEAMMLPTGVVLLAGKKTADHQWMTGMYGPNRLMFEMKCEGTAPKAWKVVPQDYLSLIGIGQVKGVDSDSLMQRQGPRKRLVVSP